MRSACEVAIVGAGPYGLSAAAHLRAAGIEIRILGRTMEFWERHMPVGMLLRSSWNASHISDPRRHLRLENYQQVSQAKFGAPVPLHRFIEYGRWFQREVATDVDPRLVNLIESTRNGFRLRLQDGEQVNAKRVVMATGIARFAYRPREFNGVACPLVSHSSDHRDLAALAGNRVIVVGSGQSAVESAALLSENGAEVELLARAPQIRWLVRSSRLHHLPTRVRRLLYHSTDVGPALVSQLVARPNLFRLLTRNLQDDIAWRSIRPAASAWLKPRVANVRFTTGRRITEVARAGDQIRLRLDDGSMRKAHHVILATGYRVNISRYCLLAPELLNAVCRVDGYPELGRGLESSVTGLHFLGAPAAYSFGPLLRFVSGTEFASRALTERITGNNSRPSTNAHVH